MKKPTKGKAKKRRFAPEFWPFLHVLAEHFATLDLSRLEGLDRCFAALGTPQAFGASHLRSDVGFDSYSE